jgi:hypothetical protein
MLTSILILSIFVHIQAFQIIEINSSTDEFENITNIRESLTVTLRAYTTSGCTGRDEISMSCDGKCLDFAPYHSFRVDYFSSHKLSFFQVSVEPVTPNEITYHLKAYGEPGCNTSPTVAIIPMSKCLSVSGVLGSISCTDVKIK